MDRDKIKTLFNKEKENFDFLKNQIENKIITISYAKCEYYEITPFSYQRKGVKKGNLLKDVKKFKSTKNLYEYGFDKENTIMMIKEGISLENQFYYQFLIYEETEIKKYKFDNSKELINVQIYYLDKINKQVKSMISQARYGAKEEVYIYKRNRLEQINVLPYEARRQPPIPYNNEVFEYSKNGELERIIKSFDNGYSEIIYEV